jgi:septum formation protein
VRVHVFDAHFFLYFFSFKNQKTMQNFNRPLILASKSPRRSQLLSEAGFLFSVQAFDTDESWPPELPNDQVAEYLAEKKAVAASHLILDDEIILAADTTVLWENQILNKPENHAEAVEMLQKLSGNKHRVVTGVCLFSKNKKWSFSENSNVYFEKLSLNEINYYINRCQPFDKAGAYGVQEWIGHCKIHRIEGTYANVMGLPVHRIYEILMREFC